MTTVLAALDDSAAARPVLETALALAPHWHAEVKAVHIGDGTGRNAQGAASSAHVTLHVLSGDVVAQLLRVAEEQEVVAIVVGARGRPGGRRPAGHIAQELIRKCDKPVVVVPPEPQRGGPFRCLLVALEGTAPGSQVLAPLFDWGHTAGFEVVAVHVDEESDVPCFSDQVQHETEAFTAEFLARHCPEGQPDTHLELRIGVPAEQVLEVCDEIHADLLAVAWSRNLEAGHARFVRHVLEHSRMPVMLVPIDHELERHRA